MIDSAVCQFLDWDSNFFGFRIGRVTAPCLDETAMAEVLSWVVQERVQCLYFLANGDDLKSVRTAEDHGFRQVDIRVTLSRSLGDLPVVPWESDGVRLATVDDIPRLREITQNAYLDSRFYADPHFPRAKCELLYQIWIEKSCLNSAGAVLAAGPTGEPAGFVTCDIDGLGGAAEGRIGLFGVGASARGQGLGQRLIIHALRWFQQRSVLKIAVVTQGRNVAAQRIYQHAGFLTSSVQLWYHRWSQR